MTNRYEKLIDRNSVTPADAAAISLIRSLPAKDRVSSYDRVKSHLSASVREFIETKLLSK